MSSQLRMCCGPSSRVSLLHIIYCIGLYFLFVCNISIANDFNSIAVNVNAYRGILEIQRTEMVAD